MSLRRFFSNIFTRCADAHLSCCSQILEPLLKGILSVGIKMCWGFGVAEVHMSHTGFLSSVELRRSSELAARAQHSGGVAADEHKEGGEGGVMLACMALLCCTNSVCDRDVFGAVVDSGLVFDGGLVVDTVLSLHSRCVQSLPILIFLFLRMLFFLLPPLLVFPHGGQLCVCPERLHAVLSSLQGGSAAL